MTHTAHSEPRTPSAPRDNRRAVACPITHKVLAYIEDDALYFWCRACRCEHRVVIKTLQIDDNPAIL